MSAPFPDGLAAGLAGRPSSENPHPKPERPASGEYYPGAWAEWLAGWCWGIERKGRSAMIERAELHALISRNIKYRPGL